MFGASHSNVQTSLAVAHGMDIAATIIIIKLSIVCACGRGMSGNSRVIPPLGQRLFAHVSTETAAQSAAPVVIYLLHDPSAHYIISAIAPRSTGFKFVDYNQVKS